MTASVISNSSVIQCLVLACSRVPQPQRAQTQSRAPPVDEAFVRQNCRPAGSSRRPSKPSSKRLKACTAFSHHLFGCLLRRSARASFNWMTNTSLGGLPKLASGLQNCRPARPNSSSCASLIFRKRSRNFSISRPSSLISFISSLARTDHACLLLENTSGS
jgi:hypothetical protein